MELHRFRGFPVARAGLVFLLLRIFFLVLLLQRCSFQGAPLFRRQPVARRRRSCRRRARSHFTRGGNRSQGCWRGQEWCRRGRPEEHFDEGRGRPDQARAARDSAAAALRRWRSHAWRPRRA